ncbi:MAG: hypothetical protein R3E83_14685 [Burkholderiaceae bacterium]
MTDSIASNAQIPDHESLRKITIFDYAMHIASPIVSMMMLSIIALIITT